MILKAFCLDYRRISVTRLLEEANTINPVNGKHWVVYTQWSVPAIAQ